MTASVWPSRISTNLVLLALAACGGPAEKSPVPPPLPTGFTPVAEVGDPPPAKEGALGRDYLMASAELLQPRWSSFLTDLRLRLPPSHPLNRRDLFATVAMTVGPGGALHSVQIDRGSGLAAFDDAAIEVVRDADPLPRPPAELASDDGLVHLRWTFARGSGQAGPATASVEIVRWPLERAIPDLLEAARFDLALARIAESDESPTERVRFLDEVSLALLELSLAGPPAERDAAIAAAGRSQHPRLREPVRGALAAVDSPERKRAAIEAYAAVGGPPAVLVELTRSDDPQSARAAAAALRELGRGSGAVQGIEERLEASGASRRAALAVLAEIAAPQALDQLAALARGSDRALRLAAIEALGRAATVSSRAALVLIKLVKDRDARIRAASCQALGSGGQASARRRAAYWAAIEERRHRDRRVKAACIGAAARLEPDSFADELYRWQDRAAPEVYLALAPALAAVPGEGALKILLELARSDDRELRSAAAASLAKRSEPEAQAALAGMLEDSDVAIRLIAVRHVDTAEALATAAADEDPEVRAVALLRKSRSGGRLGQVEAVAEAMAAAEGVPRIILAGVWLGAARKP